MPTYTDEIDTAFELIQEFGGEFFIRVPKSEDDTSWPPVDASSGHVVIGVDIVEGGDRNFYTPAKDAPVVPAPGMMVFKGALLIGKIAEDGVNEINPNGEEPIVYICRLEQWPSQTS